MVCALGATRLNCVGVNGSADLKILQFVTATWGGGDQALIEMNILIRHLLYAESFLKGISARLSIEVSNQWQHVDHLVETVTGESCDAIVYHLRRIASRKGHDRCATGQGFRDAES